MNKDTFLVPIGDIADQQDTLTRIVMAIFSSMPSDAQNVALEKSAERGGLMKVSIIIEGVEMPLNPIRARVDSQMKEDVTRLVRQWIDTRSNALSDALGEAFHKTIESDSFLEWTNDDD